MQAFQTLNATPNSLGHAGLYSSMSEGTPQSRQLQYHSVGVTDSNLLYIENNGKWNYFETQMDFFFG
jgi:hypothetical protein